jgi:hypothetical protein
MSSGILLEVEFSYWSVVFTAEQQRALIDASVTPVEFGADGKLKYGSTFPIIAPEFLGPLTPCEPKIRRVVANGSTAALAAFGQRNTTVVNERCQVAVAGLGLLTVDEVVNHNDMCTEALQKELDEGWRILAVCVQPDQRRPDYILGRTRQP